MTSKEALTILLSSSYFYNGNIFELSKARAKIIKDIEMLEILKKNIIIIKDKEEFNKVKEWLNEK